MCSLRMVNVRFPKYLWNIVLDIHQCIPGTPDSPGMVKFDRQHRVSALLLNMKSAETRLWEQLGNDIGYVWDCAGASDSPGKVRFEKQNRVSALLLKMKSAETRLWKKLSNDIGYDYRSVTFFQRFLLQQLHVAQTLARVPCAAVAVQI